ncbi:MAG: hypothetical protein EA362_00965 [Saprospirales bacterium]|nr:MAG: hypothetical protein EA362_00965 [Saprospirales bacterium]
MKSYTPYFRKLVLFTPTIFFVFNIGVPLLFAENQILYDRSYGLDSGKIVFLNSNQAAVRVIEWEGEKDSVRLVLAASPNLSVIINSSDFLDYIEIEFTSTEVGPKWDFSIVDAPAYWWKNFSGLKEKVDAELFYIDLYISPNLLMLQAEIYNGSLNTYDGFPTSMQFYLNQAKGNLQGSYWTLLGQIENSKLEIESAQHIMMSSSYSEVEVFSCKSFMGSASYSKLSLFTSGTIDFNGEYSKLEITLAESFMSRVLSHSEVKVFFLKEAEITGSETEIDFWYLLKKLDLHGEKLNLNIRHMGRSVDEMSIVGKLINADIGSICTRGIEYHISALNTEVHLSCKYFIFDEKKEVKSGKCKDENYERVLNLNMDLENSKIKWCEIH